MDSQSITPAPARSFSTIIGEQDLTSLELLTSRVALEKILEITRHLPEKVSHFWGFEIPLSTELYSSDFLCCINNPQVLFSSLAGGDDVRVENEYVDTFRHIRNLCRHWSGAADSMGINNIWLEFDCKDLFSTSPVANFFFGPKNFANHLDLIALCEEVFKHIAKKPVSASTYRFLLKCLQLLPPSSCISQMGIMLARNDDELRLCNGP